MRPGQQHGHIRPLRTRARRCVATDAVDDERTVLHTVVRVVHEVDAAQIVSQCGQFIPRQIEPVKREGERYALPAGDLLYDAARILYLAAHFAPARKPPQFRMVDRVGANRETLRLKLCDLLPPHVGAAVTQECRNIDSKALAGSIYDFAARKIEAEQPSPCGGRGSVGQAES